MSTNFESVYPDFLRAGLVKLQTLGAPQELFSLFTALEHFRRDLHAQDSNEGILAVSQRYISGLNLFATAGFYLVNPTDFGFELMLGDTVPQRTRLEAAVEREIAAGRFAWALRRTAPVFFHSTAEAGIERGILHALALSTQVLGMFCGLLREEREPMHDIASSLLSLLIGESTDALATLRKTAQLTGQIKTLSGLLPICAWCKKVRDDRGYWEQIEQYVRTRTDASFSHGICPDCKGKFFGNAA